MLHYVTDMGVHLQVLVQELGHLLVQPGDDLLVHDEVWHSLNQGALVMHPLDDILTRSLQELLGHLPSFELLLILDLGVLACFLLVLTSFDLLFSS